ncbi:molybdate ABC transporter substrate binding protein [Gordonia effusa NBRC 100432]|uniref:Molybdate ABC transporter substrate binding protein n=1 Tax=Gordonia effusa NBRC 100432 TaxID=1077974 RepID=H0R031_9ACTN|nr:molybdate ABC transporter substrate-binding protein [Gordonia effusa]GAB18432.1 molybdate ABC transporter substrate binding protein [Gordonia effusa NBRC 100432]
MKKLFALAIVAAALLLAGCSSTDDAASTESAPPTTLNVYAAASLKKTFTTIAADFEKAHQGVKVTLSFDGSSTLVNQIKQGAPADVFASADQKNMAKLGDKANDPKVFATNTLVIVTAPGNPKGIHSIGDLNKVGVTTVVCQSAQPCGNATDTVEKNTGITIRAASQEQSVTAVLTKVTSGQADAGLVYVTDAKGAGNKVATVVDPAFAKVVNTYPIAVTQGSANDGVGKEFVDAVLSPAGQKVLQDAGFGKP